MSSKIKILHVIQKMHSGGVERRKLILLEHMDQQMFEHKIICSEADSNLKKKFDDLNCEVFEVGYLSSPVDYRVHTKAYQIIRQFQPHIIHGSVFEGNTITALMGSLAKVPIRILEETSYPNLRSWRANQLIRLFSTLSHCFIAISPVVATYLDKIAKVNPSKIRMIYNGVNPPKFSSLHKITQLKENLGIQPDDFVIGSVGRMENDVKGFDRLIPIFAKLLDQKSNLKLLIVGHGQMLNEYKKLTRELNIKDNVIFTGYQSDVNPYYEIMDLYTSLSRSEGFGVSVVEAMSHSLPIIAENIGGLGNIIQDHQNGILVQVDQQEATKIFLQIIQQPQLREKLRQNAKASYQAMFTSKHYSQQVEKLYYEMINTI